MIRAFILAAALMLPVANASAQVAQEGQWPSALAQDNIKKMKKAPVNFTGTWNMIIDQKNGGFRFMPTPPFKQSVLDATARAAEFTKKGMQYRDDSGACWPLGMPAMMLRFWPVQIIQLPTMVQLTAMFNNSVRWIYTDGRPHPDDEHEIETYNGHSVGHWEGKTLVVDTVGMTDDHHWIQPGVPAGPKLHIIERYTMSPDGKTMNIQFTMTDPDHWEGEWVNTKSFTRQDKMDIEEHVCILEQMEMLPSFKYNYRGE